MCFSDLIDTQQLYNALYSPSLFSNKQLIEIDLPSSISNKTITTILKEYVKKPFSQYLLLLTTGKIDTKKTKNAYYQAIEESGVIITIWPLSREQLLRWIHQQAKKYHLQFQPAAAHLLANYVEGNSIAAAQAIEKCYLLPSEKIIDEKIIESIMINETQFTIFDFVDSIIAGNLSRSINILSALKLDHIEPTLILWAMARELRLLNEMAQRIKQGESVENLLQTYPIFTRRQPAVRRFLMKYAPTDCWHLLLQLAEIDQSIKGGIPVDIWNHLQLFCLRATQNKLQTTIIHQRP